MDSSSTSIKISSAPAASNSPGEAKRKSSLLKDGVSLGAFAAFLFCAFLTIATFVFLNSAQSFILIDLLGVDASRLGAIQGTLSMSDEVASMALVLAWGVISDRTGRRWVFPVAFLLMSVAVTLYPLATSVYGDIGSAGAGPSAFFSSLLFFRLIFAAGGSAASDMLTVVLGEYAAEGGRARLAGLLGIATGLGACFGALVLTRLPTLMTSRNPLFTPKSTIYFSFWSTAGLLLAGACIATWRVSSAPRAENKAVAEAAGDSADPKTAYHPRDHPHDRKLTWDRVVYGFKAIKANPTLLCAYLGSFVARGDSILLSVFLPPWIYSFYAQNGLCPALTDSPTSFGTHCPEAKRLVSTLSGLSNLAALLGAPLMGSLADRWGPRRTLLLPSALGVLVYAAIPLLFTDPRHWGVKALAILQGFAQIGMIIVSVTLVAKEAPESFRGAIAGVYSLFGALGIIIVSQAGGALTQIWKETAPWAVIAGANSILLALLVFLFRKQ